MMQSFRRLTHQLQKQNRFLGHALSASHRSYLTFTHEHEQVQETARKIAEQEINPYVDQWEREQQFDSHKVFKAMGNAGLLGLTRDPEYGGQGLDYSFTIAMYEALGRAVNCGGIITGIGVQTDMALPALANFGSRQLKKQYLAPALAGDYVACVGITEAGGGSDVAALKTSAKREDDELIINGEKMWISNGIKADFMVLLANTEPDLPAHRNKSLIVVPLNSKGVSRRPLRKMGHHSSDTAVIHFDNVRVPFSNIIGDPGAGFMYQMIQFQDERLCVSAAIIPALERMIDETIDYCRNRQTFGKPLIDNQVIHFRLAELFSEIQLARALLHRAAYEYMQGNDATLNASILKLKCGRLAREVADTCLQYFGAMGYSDELPVSRAYRDMRLLSIAGGADEIMLGIIAKFMGTLPRPEKKKTS